MKVVSFRNSTKPKRGFTLIELLVVIAIIGLLSSIVLASLSTASRKSRDTRRIEDIKQIQTALALYFDTNKIYPSAIYNGSLAPAFIPTMPRHPVGTTLCTDGSQITCYTYVGIDTNGSPLTCESYHIGAVLEESTNQALLSDADATATAGCNTISDFAGTDPIYDKKP